jgi:hypothetical protein
MERNKYKDLMLDLSKLEPEELIALYVEAKTGLENPLREVPLYLQLSLTDLKDWIDNYNNKKVFKIVNNKDWNREDIREMFETFFSSFIQKYEKKNGIIKSSDNLPSQP